MGSVQQAVCVIGHAEKTCWFPVRLTVLESVQKLVESDLYNVAGMDVVILKVKSGLGINYCTMRSGDGRTRLYIDITL